MQIGSPRFSSPRPGAIRAGGTAATSHTAEATGACPLSARARVQAQAVPVQGPKGYEAERPNMGFVLAQGGQCTISTEADPNAEIRTKVFRMGAPLLRSTIPVALGTPRLTQAQLLAHQQQRKERRKEEEDDEDSDVETVLSLSDVGIDDQGALSVTLDFPC